ncbi:HET-domain-containing protein, partial [Bimuria novae-zelandiae CBS 107.79]
MRLEEITIDGEPCDLSVNLALLFQHLRKPNGVRKLWVDALCIDQANLAERGAQVAQMDRIYAHASTVHVWLGPHADGSNDSIVLAEFLWRCAFVERISPTELFTSGDEAANMATLAALEKLTILLERPWWTRRWVVQEVALAREVLVHCGRKTVEWRKLAYATLVGITENVIRRLPSPCTHPVFERRADLEGLLGQLRTLQCTNPLDTVYALLSIASDAETWGIGAPDYDRSVVEVYMEVV